MSLDPATRTRLRGRAQTLPITGKVGKEGLHENLLKSLDALFEKDALQKVKLPKGGDRKALAQELADALNAELVACVGHTAVLYRVG